MKRGHQPKGSTKKDLISTLACNPCSGFFGRECHCNRVDDPEDSCVSDASNPQEFPRGSIPSRWQATKHGQRLLLGLEIPVSRINDLKYLYGLHPLSQSTAFIVDT